MNNTNNNILKAIEIMIDQKNQKLKYDKTFKSTI